MNPCVVRFRLAAWVALIALLASLFTPALAHALTRLAGASADIPDICSASAGRETPPDTFPPGGSSHGKHCPFCCAADLVAPLAPDRLRFHFAALFAVPRGGRLPPAGPCIIPGDASPRGPPAFS